MSHDTVHMPPPPPRRPGVNDWDYSGPFDTGDRRAMERMVREALAFPTRPAVLMFSFHSLSSARE